MTERLVIALIGIATTCFVGVSGAASAEMPKASPRIELRGSTAAGHTVDVFGLSEDQQSAFGKLSPDERRTVLQVYVDVDIDDLPALEGRLDVLSDRLRFTPRYPLEEGLRYRAVFAPGFLSPHRAELAPVTQVISLEPRKSNPTTVVEQIYPSADVLPENQLKFYLHFSASMSRGEAYRHVHLLDAQGREVNGAFLELGEELWDGDYQRFTLLFDPGRVKRGLKPREELGPVIVEGQHYSLVVDGAWRDATRTPLNSGARKEFSVGPPDDKPVDPAKWRITAPAANGFDPLLVRFGEPLDHSLLERIVWVATNAGERVAGTIRTGNAEACWQFTPQRPWASGHYQLVAETTLEDLAGNSIGRPFEVDEFQAVQERIETKTISIPFEVK